MEDSDELARTATAVSGPSTPAAPVGNTLGRYRIEKTLGEGGMGVVHAAFDPDLERRVALKVLRKTDAAGDARQRLLREARAMARLTHENVVVVHEVGTAGDRDYVAMELIDGQSLADWLAAKPRSVAEIVDAFCAAGRGLAAAHAAGLVHRDFKPHNVLCARSGKIVVTDFGLARGVENSPAIALDATIDPSSSGLSGITATGSVLGTPAYMAPEQWTGGTVGPAADQFAFCVALWEALTGARPFKGSTLEELKAEVNRGASSLDASKLPRRLRKILVRGLDPDPTKRFPSMDALIAAIRRADRHIGVVLALAGAAVAVGAILLFTMHRGPTCEPPILDPGQVWQEAFGKAMPPEMSELFNAQITHWAVARATACTADPIARPVQLRCLDGVLARLDVARQAFGGIKGAWIDDLIGELVDPSVCLGAQPPRLGYPHTPDGIAAYTAYAKVAHARDEDGEAQTPAAADEVLAKPALDACSRAIALIARSHTESAYAVRNATINDAISASEQCGDDRLQADVLLVWVGYQFEQPMIGPRGIAAIKRTSSAVERVSESQLTARMELIRSDVANQQGHLDQALILAKHAAELFERGGQLRYAIDSIELVMNMQFPLNDIAAIRKALAKWQPIADQLHDKTRIRELAFFEAQVRYSTGEVASAHADMRKLWTQHADQKPPHPVEGDVVDREGKPVAGATVVSARFLQQDPIGVPVVRYIDKSDRNYLRVTTTDDQGHFKFTDATPNGAIIAQLGDRRSVPIKMTDHPKLVVQPTRRVSGKVALNGSPSMMIGMIVVDPNDHSQLSEFSAPVKPDGTFEIDGVPQTAVKIGLGVQRNVADDNGQVTFTQIPASTEPTTGLAMAVPQSTRLFDIVVRSTTSQAIENAQVIVFEGHVQLATVGDLLANRSGLIVRFAHPVTGENVPKPLVAIFREGDLVAHFEHVPEGDVTACGVALPPNLQDEKVSEKLMKHRGSLPLVCVPLDGAATTALLNTPPTMRLDD